MPSIIIHYYLFIVPLAELYPPAIKTVSLPLQTIHQLKELNTNYLSLFSDKGIKSTLSVVKRAIWIAPSTVLCDLNFISNRILGQLYILYNIYVCVCIA